MEKRCKLYIRGFYNPFKALFRRRSRIVKDCNSCANYRWDSYSFGFVCTATRKNRDYNDR